MRISYTPVEAGGLKRAYVQADTPRNSAVCHLRVIEENVFSIVLVGSAAHWAS